MSTVTIVTLDITQLNVHKHMKKTKKTAGAVILPTGSTITEKEQLLCNTHLSTICQVMIKSFHQPGTGR